MKSIQLLIVVTAFLLTSTVNASIITDEFVRSDALASSHSGTAVDANTGKYYQRDAFHNGVIHEFLSKADFESGAIFRSINTSTFGTYFEVMNGKIFSRTNISSNNVSTFDLITGNLLQTKSFASLDGGNYSGGFNWGGYSSMNFMEDNGNLYLFGNSSSTSEYLLFELDENLNTLGSYNTGIYGALGFATIVNGNLFAGSAYYVGQFDFQFDLASSVLDSINVTFASPGGYYITNMNYDGTDDTLYYNNLQGDALWAFSDASIALGVQSASVPEPSIIALFGLGLAGVGFARRRRQA